MTVQDRSGLLPAGSLDVGGRDKSSMITGMHRQVEAVRAPGPWSEEAIDRLYVRLRDAVPAHLPAAGADPAPLVEPPRRNLLLVAVQAVAWLAFVAVVAWSLASGALSAVVGVYVEWLMSRFLPGE